MYLHLLTAGGTDDGNVNTNSGKVTTSKEDEAETILMRPYIYTKSK